MKRDLYKRVLRSLIKGRSYNKEYFDNCINSLYYKVVVKRQGALDSVVVYNIQELNPIKIKIELYEHLIRILLRIQNKRDCDYYQWLYTFENSIIDRYVHIVNFDIKPYLLELEHILIDIRMIINKYNTGM